ncbi:XshC-Cox1 family protein [Streptacidiphilus pinicola]|uniref:XshC-Cox1 family protein n=1 Tax=Streptacidiphilus pinicola TaxID=2219663 RepID=A0A2X0I8G6_9ACTN|nr:XdhC/CoxI family protein [Streptacidiphilus pinicola]RAG81194.1 XshC-Cox1 family protein [Streptacidiphilus pinicola]
MREILPALRRWYAAGAAFGLATVVGVTRSAPRGPGAAMAVGPEDEVVGSVSGGCVEGAVFELAQEVVRTGRSQLATFGYSDDDAFAVGLTCGGEITLLVRPVTAALDPTFDAVAASVAEQRPVALATVLDAPADATVAVGAVRAVWPDRTLGSLGPAGLDAAVTADARGELAQGVTAQRHYGANGERRMDQVTVFLQSFAPPPRLLVFGAIDFAAAVADLGAFLGYRVTVCDARPVFATARRFPPQVEVVVDWPHRYLAATRVDPSTVICVLTHDPKFDVPVLQVALGTPAAYIGVMGSRHTHEDRLRRLREAGVDETSLARLHAPIGLDLGARTPEEVAVSIAAEIVSARWGGTGTALTDTTGSVHGPVPDPQDAADAAASTRS